MIYYRPTINQIGFAALTLTLLLFTKVAFTQHNEGKEQSPKLFLYSLTDEQQISILKNNLKTDSTSTQSWLTLGILWENRMQYDSAHYAYSKAATADTTCIKCKQQLASVLATKGKISEAIKIYQQILTNHPENITVQSQYARLLKRDGRYREAYMQFQDLISRDSTNYYLWEQLGDCAMQIDSTSAGQLAYLYSFEINPGNMPLAVKLLNGYIKGGSLIPFVMPYADIAYEQDSTYIPLIRIKGYLHYLLNDFTESEKWFEKAYTAGDSSRFTTKFLGITKYQKGNYLATTELLTKAYLIDSTDNVVNFLLAKACTEVGDWPQAIKLLNYTEDLLTPDNKEIALLYSARGDAYRKSRQFELAIEQFERAMEINPKQNTYLFEIGQTYYLADQYDKAKDYLENFISIAKDEKASKAARSKLSHAKSYLKFINREIFFLDSDNIKVVTKSAE